ncbi:MAG: tyrosine recombinase XerC subunit, partial [Friedmanniella sp.]|nr:tyrosine recombinase XerC subunit [Friedmanniella sp.]
MTSDPAVGPPAPAEFASGPGAEPLPAAFADALVDYERHLRRQRHLSEHTVRAYATDLRGLMTHLARLRLSTLGEVDLRALRSWLARQQTLGQSRSTLQRRS